MSVSVAAATNAYHGSPSTTTITLVTRGSEPNEGRRAERREVVADRVRVHARRERPGDGGDELRDAEDNHPDHVDVDAVGVERDRGVAQGAQQLAEPGLRQHGDGDRNDDDERKDDEVHALVAAELEAADGQVGARRRQAV